MKVGDLVTFVSRGDSPLPYYPLGVVVGMGSNRGNQTVKVYFGEEFLNIPYFLKAEEFEVISESR